MYSKKWLKIFAVFSLLGIGFVAGVNYKVDSLGLLKESTLDQVAKELSEGNIIAGLSNIDERIFRKKQIEHLKNDVKYIALGSSRIMQLRKNMFSNDKSNNFQNYSVSGATLEDYIALLQVHVNKFGKLPKNIIFGLDAWIFNKYNGHSKYLSLNKEYLEFMKTLDSKVTIVQKNKSKASYLLSFDYFKENLKSVSKKQNYYFVDTIDVDAALKMPDGSIYYPYKHRFPNLKEVNKSAKSYASGKVYSLEKYMELSNIKRFEKLINYLKMNKVNIYFYLTPYNPISYDILIKNKKYKMIVQAEKYLLSFAKKNNIKVVGSYNPHKYNLKNTHFFDGMHILDSGYKIIFKELKK